MQLRGTLVFLLSILAAPAFAEVVIERSSDRILAERPAPSAEKSAPGGLFEGTADKGMVGSILWFLPWVIDDSDPFANTTFFSVRNDNFDGTDASVVIEYFDDSFVEQRTDFLDLAGNELAPINVRAVGDLVTEPGAVNRGFIRLQTDGDLATDMFQINFGENFASGDHGFRLEDFCTAWRVRFLRFPGATDGTVLTFIINGPLGAADTDPPTISGEVFTESGAFINSFTVRTGLWVLELSALDLVIPGTDFGTIAIELDTFAAPSGIVLEKHSAFDKYSVGIAGVCKDLPL